MKKLSVLVMLALSIAGCSRGDSLEIPTGSQVTVEKKDGVTVSGKLLEVRPEHVVLEGRLGAQTEVRRADIRSIAAAPAPGQPEEKPDPVATTGETAASAPPNRPDPPTARVPEYREVTIPAGTVLSVALQTAVASDTSSPEDPVRGTLRRAVRIDGVEALPAGTALFGHVTSAKRSAKVKGRASLAFRFNQVDPPGDSERVALRSNTITTVAAATKKEDAAKIGGGAAGGAIIGGILGGGDGAAKGAAIGGAAGTGVVLGTRGKEVRLDVGLPVSVRLTAPLTVRVPVR